MCSSQITPSKENKFIAKKQTFNKMKTLLAFLLLVLNIAPSQLMHCSLDAHTDTDALKVLEARLPVPDTPMVNGISFAPDTVGIDAARRQKFDKLHPPIQNTPYTKFFKESRLIKEQTRNPKLAQLATKVTDMISTLRANNEPIGNWLYRTDAKACFKLAHEALEEGCEENERIWTVGILAAILHYYPSHSGETTAEKAYLEFDWSNQVKADIQATKDLKQDKTQESKSVGGEDM
ncbi:hypothetical protein DFH28DRAFT_983358 [Melampsora americana]|nr:hypothetical protein DFH28DRAFT_983358 [Melampsora americana]